MKNIAITTEFSEIISRRTKEGMADARANGVLIGRPPKDAKAIEEAVKLYYGRKKYSNKRICELTGLSNATLYRYIEKLSFSEVDTLRRNN